MAQRILTLTLYLLRTLLFSLAGLIYILLGLAFWYLFFNPRQQTPEIAYYILVIGVFGAGLAFLVALSIASRAHRAANYPLLVRLPSRVEHLTATLLSTLIFTWGVQAVVALLATINGPDLSLVRFLEIPPLWIAVDVLAVTLALHASDLVAAGWSRVYVFGALAVLLFGQGINDNTGSWFSGRLLTLSSWLYRQGWAAFGEMANRWSSWFAQQGGSAIGSLFGLIFWPFHAISDAVVAGGYAPAQAFAPAILLLYATLLFLLAADLFAGKDLYLMES